MEAPEAELRQTTVERVAAAHRLLVLTVQALQLGMAAQAPRQLFLEVQQRMQAAAVAALMLAARQVQAAQAAVVLDQIQVLPEPMELPTQAAEAVRDRNIVPAQQARVVQAAPVSSFFATESLSRLLFRPSHLPAHSRLRLV
jgi:hypothetical protein